MTITTKDVLDTPEMRRHTARVLALMKIERDDESRAAYAVADIGDELIAAKAALDRTADKTAWQRWLGENVNFTKASADNYMRVARLRKKSKNVFTFFSRVDRSALYIIAELPDDLLAKLIADPRLASPKTGAMTPLDDMSTRDLIAALMAFRGRKKQPGPAAGTREALAQACLAAGRVFLKQLLGVRAGSGKLSADTKRAMLDFIEQLREAVLHWPAWVTPQKGKRVS